MPGTWELVFVMAAGLAALGWLAGFAALFRVPTIKKNHGPLEEPRSISVIIPARNEEHRLGPLLGSLAAQRGVELELVVVDDHSTDATATLAETHGARVVAAPPKPEGWTGKNWACHTGAAAATGELLLFLDADTRLYQDGVQRLVHAWQSRGGVISVQPYHRVEKRYEQLSAFFNLIVMIGVDAFGLFSIPGRPAGAFGPCLLCSREDYERVGGHEKIHGHVVDDMALAVQFTAAGVDVFCYGGRGLVDFQMYPEGRTSLVEGWTKNLATASGMSAKKSLFFVSCWMSGMFTSLFLVCTAAFGPIPESLIGALAIYLGYVLQIRYQSRRVGSFRFYVAAFFPVYLGYFNVLFARSIYLTRVRRTVRWKGRDIPVGE